MLDRIKKAINRPDYPSAVVVLGPLESSVSFLHLTPEDGTIELAGGSHRSPTFRYAGAREQAREQLGTVCFYSEGKDDSTFTFFDDVKARASKLYDETYNSINDHKDKRSTSDSAKSLVDVGAVDELVKKVLRPAALDAIRNREGKGRGNIWHTRNDYWTKEKEKENESKLLKEHPVYIIYVRRPKPGQLITDDLLTSFPHR